MAVQTGEWWKKPAPTPWYKQPAPVPWYKTVTPAKPASKANWTLPAGYNAPGDMTQVKAALTKFPAAQGGGGGGAQTATSAEDSYYAQQQREIAQKKAEDDAKRGKLRGQAGGYLDQLMAMYDEILGLISKTGEDTKTRINTKHGDKVLEQIEMMKEGQYQTDAANAANNLANSSFMAFDRSKVSRAKDANVKVLDDERDTGLATVGRSVSEESAKFNADKAGIGRTRSMLGETEDIGELTSTVNNLDASVRGTQAAKGKYGTHGEFVAKANALGTFDTTALDKSMAAVISNTSATPESKQATIEDLLNGSAATEEQKKTLRNKYSQVV